MIRTSLRALALGAAVLMLSMVVARPANAWRPSRKRANARVVRPTRKESFRVTHKHPSQEVEHNDIAVVRIIVDGLNREALKMLIDAGKLPAFKKLQEEGALMDMVAPFTTNTYGSNAAQMAGRLTRLIGGRFGERSGELGSGYLSNFKMYDVFSTDSPRAPDLVHAEMITDEVPSLDILGLTAKGRHLSHQTPYPEVLAHVVRDKLVSPILKITTRGHLNVEETLADEAALNGLLNHFINHREGKGRGESKLDAAADAVATFMGLPEEGDIEKIVDNGKYVLTPSADMTEASLHGPDQMAHAHGVFDENGQVTEPYEKALVGIDRGLWKLIRFMDARKGDDGSRKVALVVTSDHGQVNVDSHVNVHKALNQEGIRATGIWPLTYLFNAINRLGLKKYQVAAFPNGNAAIIGYAASPTEKQGQPFGATIDQLRNYPRKGNPENGNDKDKPLRPIDLIQTLLNLRAKRDRNDDQGRPQFRDAAELVIGRYHESKFGVFGKDRAEGIIEVKMDGSGKPTPNFAYTVAKGHTDPFGFTSMESAKRLVGSNPDAPQFHTAQEWLDATGNAKHPDAIVSIAQLMLSPHIDFAISAPDGVELWTQDQKGSHGSLGEAQAKVPWMLYAPSLGAKKGYQGVTRAIDTTQTIREMLDVRSPEAIWLAKSRMDEVIDRQKFVVKRKGGAAQER